MLVPAGTIMVVWVPHGLLLLEPDVSYYVQLAEYVLPSFVASLILAAIASWKFVGSNERPIEFTWVSIAAPTLVIAICASAYKIAIPERGIPSNLNHDSLENLYGSHFDETIQTLQLTEEHLDDEVSRLNEVFSKHPEILSVSLEEPNTRGTVFGSTFYYAKDTNPPGSSCSRTGPIPENQRNLIRCTLDYGMLDKIDTLRYIRNFEYEDELLELEVQFDFEKVREVIDDSTGT